MSDESKAGRDRINLEQDYEVRVWFQSHDVTDNELRNAVREIESFVATLEILVDQPCTNVNVSDPGATSRDRTSLR